MAGSLASLTHLQVDLIILGTHGRTGAQKLLLGSSAEEIFRRAHIPVLTIGPAVRSGSHNGGRFRCVLFATEFNAVSEATVPYAVSLAQENQSHLVLLHVLPKPKPEGRKEMMTYPLPRRCIGSKNSAPADAELWCRPEAMVGHGDPTEQILAAAHQCGADLIVLGVRGMGRLAGASLI